MKTGVFKAVAVATALTMTPVGAFAQSYEGPLPAGGALVRQQGAWVADPVLFALGGAAVLGIILGVVLSGGNNSSPATTTTTTTTTTTGT